MSKLPINLTDLLRQRTVEGERIEDKAGWNPDAVVRTLCAFANDFENLGGVYLVIGQDCDINGQAAIQGVEDSVVYSDNGWVLAPAYDLLSTAIDPTLSPKMAMKFGSKYRFDEVRARHYSVAL